MKKRSPLWIALALVVLVAASALATGAVRVRPPFEVLESRARAAGIVVDARAVERGLFEDRLRDVRATLREGVVVRASDATLSRSPFGTPSLRAPALEVTLAGDPLQAHARFDEVAAPEGLDVQASRVSVRYRHRALGALALDGVSSPAPQSLRAKTLELGGARFSDVSLAFRKRKAALEVALGADQGSEPRATATYVPSDGRAAEWRLMLPHQPLSPLRLALGLGVPSPEDSTRVGGTLSWIVPDDTTRYPRGHCQLVLDAWPWPSWPDAKALTGSSGAVAAFIRASAASDELKLERVEVGAALFALQGDGTITLGRSPKVQLAASGRRTCAELAQGLPPSRHREAVRAYLGPVAELPPGGNRREGGRREEWVELGLRVELEAGVNGALRFLWHLSPGCGLPEMTAGPSGSSGDPAPGR
jgi:hypothetical protein